MDIQVHAEPHASKSGEWVVLGRETTNPPDQQWYTRRSDGEFSSHQYSGDYDMSFDDAVKDFQRRRNS